MTDIADMMLDLLAPAMAQIAREIINQALDGTFIPETRPGTVVGDTAGSDEGTATVHVDGDPSGQLTEIQLLGTDVNDGDRVVVLFSQGTAAYLLGRFGGP